MKPVFDALVFVNCFGFLVVKFFQLPKILGSKPKKEDKDVLA
jgi:hypothetical protein